MRSSGKWKATLAAGVFGSILCAGTALGTEARMQTQRPVARRSAAVQGRVVAFKPERTDSWLCTYVSPFFCSSIPTVSSTPQGGAQTTSRGRH